MDWWKRKKGHGYEEKRESPREGSFSTAETDRVFKGRLATASARSPIVTRP
jgi:hypothetical protein